MRSTTPHDLRGHCPRCLLREEACLCPAIPRVETRTEVVIVRHVAEARLTSNTGRLAALALPRSRIVDYGGRTSLDDSQLALPGSWLLYPTERARPAGPAPLRLVVLDATWAQARRMYTRIPALRALPDLSLGPPDTAVLHLRQPPQPGARSTLEAIAAALRLLEGDAVADPLDRLHEELVRRFSAVRGRHQRAI